MTPDIQELKTNAALLTEAIDALNECDMRYREDTLLEYSPEIVSTMRALLSALSAAEARAEAAEEILQRMLTAEVEYSEGIPCGYGPPVYTALELAIMAREALDTLKGAPDGR